MQYHRNATVVSDPVLRLEDVPGEESAFEPELTKRLVRRRARMRGGGGGGRSVDVAAPEEAGAASPTCG